MGMHETGTLEILPRFFEQSRSQAMRGQVERGLVELVTNCDDSYRELEDQGVKAKGDIRIEIERRRRTRGSRAPDAPSKVIVRDRAAGMTAEDMKEKILKVGGRTSGFERGRRRRGFHGRGAKDLTEFGPVTFESIKDDQYAICVLRQSLKYTLDSQKADDETRQRLRIRRGNGTVVTVEVRKGAIPQHEKMITDGFCRHYALRDIFSDSNRKVTLVDLNNDREDGVHYRYPECEIVLPSEQFSVPGYGERATATLQVFRCEKAFQGEDKHGPAAAYRQGGILIRSAAAIHEVTLFCFENEDFAQRFWGFLDCPYIDDLVFEYDEREEADPDNAEHPESNPHRLLKPDRSGVLWEHPFAKALKQEAEKRLRRLVDDEKRKAGEKDTRIESELVARRLRSWARKYQRWLDAKRRELEVEPPVTPPVGPMGEWREGITIIPPGEHSVCVGHRKTFTALVNVPDGLPPDAAVAVKSDTEAVAVITPQCPIRFDEDSLTKGRASFTVAGGQVTGAAFVSASLNGYQDVVLVEVVDVPEPPPPVEIPSGLSFDRDRYTVRSGRPKGVSVFLRSDDPLPAKVEVRVSSTHSDIVVLGGGLCRLTRSSDGTHLDGVFDIEGRRLGARGKLQASWQDLSATAEAQVVDGKPHGAGMQIKIANREFGVLRAKWHDQNPDLLEVAGKHPAIRRYLGAEEEGYPGKDSAQCQAVLAEVVADAVCMRYLQEREDKLGRDDDMDVAAFHRDYMKEMRELLPMAHEDVPVPTSG
jgi:hypothetical protein